MTTIFHRLALAAKPAKLRQALLRRVGSPTLDEKVAYDLFSAPQYAYGVYHAALQARQLGLDSMSVIEFGVAGGNGLVALEQLSKEIGDALRIKIAVFGFDTGSGMPESVDYRDLPYLWQKGFFAMDVEALRKRLKHAVLMLGNVADSIQDFVQQSSPPIGFIGFDLDYYSSTVQAFTVLKQANSCYLPRVFCFFDDTVGGDWELHSEYAGELLAITEFNSAHEKRKIAKIHGLPWKRQIPSTWNDAMFVCHLFDHPQYCKYVFPEKSWHLHLIPN